MNATLILVVVLSWLFLHESFGPLKLAGVTFTLTGVATLSVVA